MLVVLNWSLRLVAVALFGVAAAGQGQPPTRAKYTVLERPPTARVAKPEFRVSEAKGATTVTIFAGEKPTGGYSVDIKGVDRSGDTCTVRYKVGSPGPDAIVTQVLTYPAAAVRISPSCREVRVDPPVPRGGTKADR